MNVKEEVAVAASIVLNLYNDVENLLTHTGTYISQYQALYAQYHDAVIEGGGSVPEDQRKALVDLSATLKVLVYRTYVRAKTLAKKQRAEIPKSLVNAYEAVLGDKSTDNLILLHPTALTKYVEEIYGFTADTTMSDLMKTSRDVLKDLGG